MPGDVVSLYAIAKDARAESRTDISFVQADPFEREFSQAQAAGGGAVVAEEASKTRTTSPSARKEIIAETWKHQGDKKATQQAAAEAAKFLSGVQSKLRDQSKSLAGRMQSRELSQENEEFNSFVKDMNAAADAMGPAAEKLQNQKWQDALPDEQKALQNLLRAEATFRQIQVAFGSSAGAAGRVAEQGATSRACLIWSWTRRKISMRRRKPPAPPPANRKRKLTKHCRNWTSWRAGKRS